MFRSPRYSGNTTIMLSFGLASLLLASIGGCTPQPSSRNIDGQQLLRKIQAGMLDSTSCYFFSSADGKKWLTANEHMQMTELLEQMLSSPNNRICEMPQNHKCAPEMNLTFYTEGIQHTQKSSPILVVRGYLFSDLIIEIVPNKECGIQPLCFLATAQMYSKTKTLISSFGQTCTFPIRSQINK